MTNKITAFNRSSANLVAARVERALQDVAAEFGIQIKRGRGTFSGSTFSLKLEMAIVNSDGVVETQERRALKMLYPEYVDLKILLDGGLLSGKVVGFRTRASKRPFLIEGSDGKTYVTTETAVRHAHQRSKAGG